MLSIWIVTQWKANPIWDCSWNLRDWLGWETWVVKTGYSVSTKLLYLITNFCCKMVTVCVNDYMLHWIYACLSLVSKRDFLGWEISRATQEITLNGWCSNKSCVHNLACFFQVENTETGINFLICRSVFLNSCKLLACNVRIPSKTQKPD